MMHAYATLQNASPFARAARYAALEVPADESVREGPARGKRFPHSERHLQCVWLDPSLRPLRLLTSDGEELRVDDPGAWNHEAGPDFLGASFRVGPQQRRLVGDVEIHVRPSDWKNHRHYEDPRYANVRVHVTYFPGRAEPGLLPPGTLEVALQEPLAANPYFSFETIDLSAYPYTFRQTQPSCAEVLASWTPEEIGAFLDAAGEERLRRKSERLAFAVEERGPGQVLYEELLCALGYKHNKNPFRLLAKRVPLDELREAATGDAPTAYAILMGVSGLLPQTPHPGWDEETKAFVRANWDRWWPHQQRWASRQLEPTAWRLSNVRPANRPERRMMAAAHLFTRSQPLHEDLRELTESGPAKLLAAITTLLESPSDPYWDRRYSFESQVQAKPAALLGSNRARAMMVNVVLPFLGVSHAAEVFDPACTDKLPGEGDNQLVRQTAHYLFGPDHSERLYASGLRKQGLVQVFYDYCIDNRSHLQRPLADLLMANRERFDTR